MPTAPATPVSEDKPMTNIERLAEGYRLKVTRDDCNDQIIAGRRGQLYYDENQLCLLVLNGKPAIRSRWETLGGKLWLGDISPDAKGRRVQDVKITGIDPGKIREAMRLIRVFPKRQLSEASKAAARERVRAINSRLERNASGQNGPEGGQS